VKIAKKLFSYPYEVEDSISYTPCQDIELIDPSSDYVEGVSDEGGLVDSPSFHKTEDDLNVEGFDDLFYIGGSKWNMTCFYFDGDPIYDTENEGEDIINELGHDIELNLEDPDEKTTSPSHEEHEAICPPQHKRVKYEYSLPCVLESLPLLSFDLLLFFTLDPSVPSSSLPSLTHEYSPSLPLTKKDMESQPLPYISQLEPPSQPFVLT
jgi:hypothetical protein